MKLEVDELLVVLIQTAVQKAINKLFLEHGEEKFYYCSLITTGEGLWPVISAWSEEALERVAKQEADIECDIEEAKYYLKWSYGETPYFAYGEEYFKEVEEVFYERMSRLKTESEIDREIALRMNSMEKVMYNLDMQGVFGRGEKRLGIVINVEVMPPDFTNTQRALRLNPKEALNEWLDEAAEELEIGNLGGFKFTSSTDLEKTIEIEMFEEKYDAFVFLKDCTSWSISDALIEITIKFMEYLEKNIKKLEEKILDYYQNQVKEMAKDQNWIDEYICIKSPKGLSEVMKLSEIEIFDYGDNDIDIMMVFSCDWDENEFMISFDKNLNIKEIGSCKK